MIVVRRVNNLNRQALFSYSAAKDWRSRYRDHIALGKEQLEKDRIASKEYYRNEIAPDWGRTDEAIDSHYDDLLRAVDDPDYAPDWVKKLDEESSRASSGKAKPLNSKAASSGKAKPLNSKALLAGLALAGAVGAVGAGAYFIRRRRSKKGKTIVERVRR